MICIRTKVLYNECMNVHVKPDTLTQLNRLGNITQHEPAGDHPQRETPSLLNCVSHVTTPQGKKAVLKTMLTTACERNCHYCVFRAGRSKTERVSFTPDEMAKAFNTLEQAGQVDGAFLSSGIIKGGVTTQDKILDTAEIIRKKYDYQGYLHLKLMPGAEYDQVHRAMQLADRVSINLEGPTEERLNLLAPKKDFMKELLEVLRFAAHIRQNHQEKTIASITTQFVVGAVGDTDLEVLSVSERLYKELRLSRAYYMGFNPVEQTPFENLPSSDDRRILRLYQSSFLLRDYGWTVEDFLFSQDGNLPMDHDPKILWANTYLRENPVDVVRADREHLLRVPGIGRKTADAILRARKQVHLTDLAQLQKLGVPARAVPYILLDGKKLPVQLSLFPSHEA